MLYNKGRWYWLPHNGKRVDAKDDITKDSEFRGKMEKVYKLWIDSLPEDLRKIFMKGSWNTGGHK